MKRDDVAPVTKEDQMYWRNKWIKKQFPRFITI